MIPGSIVAYFDYFHSHYPCAALLTDIVGNIATANTLAADLLGYSMEELAASNIRSSVQQECWPALDYYLQAAVGGESAEFDVTLLMTSSGSSKATKEVKMRTVPNRGSGGIQTVTIYLQDVNATKKQLLEPSVFSEINNLEHLNTVSQLAASISHEVRNPLTVTRGFLQLLKLPDLADNKRVEYIKLSLSELDRAESIISDYLNFAKPTLDDVETLDLNHQLDYIAKVMLPFATLKNVQYCNTCSPEPLLLHGNAKKLQQALVNMIKNGIEAMQDGGEIHIEATKEEEDMALVKIRDTGMGMDPESLERLGRPFYTTKDKGTGLGTMVAFSIIKSMRGEIKVDSKLGEGTTFWICFPIQKH